MFWLPEPVFLSLNFMVKWGMVQKYPEFRWVLAAQILRSVPKEGELEWLVLYLEMSVSLAV